MRVSGILCVTTCLTQTGSVNNLGRSEATLGYCLIQDPAQEQASVQNRAGLDQTPAIKEWLLLPFSTDIHAFHVGTVQCHGCCPDLQGVEESLIFFSETWWTAQTNGKMTKLAYKKTNPFSELTLLKNTDIRQPNLWEISCCINTSRWSFRHSWQQRDKNKTKKKLTREVAKKVFWNPQCSWGMMREERLRGTREKTEIIIP